ncbi:MAG: hydrogen gas-evolving membrane-bound hydrogenase subunit E [Phycisphaeraceae bacterium]
MADPQVLLLIIVFLPLAAATLALLVGRFLGAYTGVLMAGSAAVCCGLVLWLLRLSPADAPVVYDYAWMPELGVHFRLRADPFGLFFAMLISGIGTLVGIYSLGYIDPKLAANRLGRYYAALIAFMAAMLGVALSDDLILLFIFWEITSITSYMLIGFWYELEVARKGALTALLVTAMGGLAMMVGFVAIGVVAETFTISQLSEPETLARLTGSPLFVPAMLLVLLGAFTKSAQVPWHFWLPGAMVAPTPVSTYLHAATMVKAGVFLVGRMLPIFAISSLWSPILVIVGLWTFSLSAYQALYETDLKAILARTTLSTLGLIMMIYGLDAPNQDALQMFSHAGYKGALFLVAGIVEHATHTRDLRDLGGLRKAMPITFVLCVLAALSMSGLPPFFGFLAKEALYDALLHNAFLAQAPAAQWGVIALVILSNAFIFAVSFKLIIGIFLGKPSDKAHHAHEASPVLWMPVAVLAVGVLVLGLLGFTNITEHLVNALSSRGHGTEHLHVSLVPHAVGPLVLSLITIALGIVIYRARRSIETAQLRIKAFIPSAQGLWDGFIHGVTWAAENYSRRWQNGSLRWYFIGILGFYVLITLWVMNKVGLHLGQISTSLLAMPWYGAALCGLMILAMFTVVTATTRLGATIALSATGFLVSLMFVVYRSPDILLTQILIETVSTIFVLLILYHMPQFKRDQMTPGNKLLAMGISAGVGVVIFTLLMLTMSPLFRAKDTLGAGYLARTLSEGFGQNAVNVIIVDVRAIDTTGEITVLVVVGLLVYSVLRARRKTT